VPAIVNTVILCIGQGSSDTVSGKMCNTAKGTPCIVSTSAMELQLGAFVNKI
jgi:hypothetical protein